MYPYRARFKKEIVAEFLPPSRKTKKDRVILLCDGMPGIPSKQSLALFLSQKGFWVIHPRYRGTWESGGLFLRESPAKDILDIVHELPKSLRELTFGKKFTLNPEKIYVIGCSFGGAAAVLSTLDPKVDKAVAICPVVDWKASRSGERKETSNKSYPAYLKEAFGEAYRFRPKDWAKLYTKRFYNPAFHTGEIDPQKLLLFHAQDDPYVPFQTVESFAYRTRAKLVRFKRAGHLSMNRTVQKNWARIKLFLK
jgi:pimeloyl-ACP methyl ester carboxylesterase